MVSLGEEEIGKLITFSFRKDLRHIDSRYKDLLSVNRYGVKFFDFLRARFFKRHTSFTKKSEVGMKENLPKRDTDILLFSKAQVERSFFVHVEVSVIVVGDGLIWTFSLTLRKKQCQLN